MNFLFEMICLIYYCAMNFIRRLIGSWSGDNKFSLLITKAIRDGDTESCKEYVESGKCKAEFMLMCAAFHGNQECCHLAKNLAKNFAPINFQDAQNMLRMAALGGQRSTCELAIQWGATDYNGMLCYAARNNHVDICELAIELGATDFNEMLSKAGAFGQIEMCQRAIDRGANNFNYFLEMASFGGHEDCCLLAISYGATDYDCMYVAACGGFNNICRLAKKLDARDYEKMLKHAFFHSQIITACLAKYWIINS